MKNIFKNSYLILSFVVAFSAKADVTDFAASPPLLSDTTTPLIMLAMPNDHQLYYKAYTDWDDLDGDGTIEITYTHSIDYAGYFDSYKCYSYLATSQRFDPQAVTTDKYCNGVSGEWSGNFLNWASMTRMDEIRKVLYGGQRSTDTASRTVLERAFLPNDAHSFAKYYNGSDLFRLTEFNGSDVNAINADASNSGITICNTTDASRSTGEPRRSEQVDDPPLMKIVKGNYSLWAASERFQCAYNDDGRLDGNKGENGNSPSSLLRAYGDSPNSSERIGEYVVRVSVCQASLLGTEDCKEYPSGNYKPVGLLQEFGDDDSVHFGLMTGSFLRNKDGGILRKNIGSISDEVNIDTDGTFKSAAGIIQTLDTFRIVGYEFWNWWDDSNHGTYRNYDDCTWGRSSFPNGDCKNWGNPFAEILLECYRYFGGQSATTSYSTSDTSVLSGLSAPSWVSGGPVTSTNACAKLNVIAFNASTISYDGDGLSGFSDIVDSSDPTVASSAAAATNRVGIGEGISGNDYFVGEAEGSGDQLCTGKTVNNLGTVEGTCSDAPRLDGTYNVAGIAHHAHVNDIAPSVPGDQLVTTYGVTLSPAIPEVKIPVPGSSGKTVSILPACRNNTVGGNCGLVDFKILVPYTLSGSKARGAFYVNWEDSEQGGDYDQDMAGVLSYEISSTEIEIETQIVGESTPNAVGFGYILGGTDDDGFHAHSGIHGYNGFGCASVSGGCQHWHSASDEDYNIGTSSASLLEQPLYYAAKWGGFVSDGTIDSTVNEPIPDNVSEWDVKNNSTGAYGSDGVPDNYFLAIDPAELKGQLQTVIRDILARTSSGTAASVVTSTGAGEGAVYQALYNPRYDSDSGTGNQSVTWVGTLHALFLDRYGELREDIVPTGESAGELTNSDPIVTIYYDAALGKTMIQRYNVGTDGKRSTALGTPVEIDEIDPIWSARDQLSSLTNLTSNRLNFSSSAAGGRYIFTGIDDDSTGWIEQDEITPFESSTFLKSGGTDNFRLLGFEDADTDTEIGNLINFLRGDETVSGMRNRTIEYDGNLLNGEEPWLLGDIVHSSPAVLTRPTSFYDLTYNDKTYKTFVNEVSDRRQVVYVGANDGMLHAFNGGFFDPTTKNYKTTNGTETAHPLGSEMWAYVPYNLLPHLNYLADPSYPHVYYVDGEPQVFEVNDIWSAGSGVTHPEGWGSILVVGMRFGGGEIQVDPDSDIDADTSDDLTMRSSFIIMDVTDPESPPEIIGEISHADLGYTVSRPTLIKHRSVNPVTGTYETPATNNWYLVFGSGPAGTSSSTRKDALDHATSTKSAKVFIYDLKNRSLSVVDTGISNAFVGGITAADWNNDFIDDAIYFGVVGGTEASPSGRLMRAKLNWNTGGALTGTPLSMSNVVDVTTQAFSAAPTISRDRSGNFWVFSGTGRFYTVEDNLSTATQSYYGIKDPDAAAMGGGTTVIHNSELVETTGIDVFANGTVRRSGSSSFTLNTGQIVDSYNKIQAAVVEEDGWFFDFSSNLERSVTKAALSEESLVFTTYTPTGQACDPDGEGKLYAPSFQTGLPGPFAPLDTDSSTTFGSSELVNMSVSLGIGNPSAPTIYRDAEGKSRAIVQTSTGEIVNQHIEGDTGRGKRQSWREVPITW